MQSLSADAATGQLAELRHTAVEVGQATLDVLLIHRPPAEIDLGRVDAWATQVGVDAAIQDQGAVAGDVASIEVTWSRVRGVADSSTSRRVDRLLGRLRSAADRADLDAAARLADKLRAALEHADVR
jgi:hypothetical protein